MSDRPLEVLVPDDLGVEVLGATPGLQPVRYRPGHPWPADHTDVTAVVVGHEDAAAVGARLAELPRLRLVQTLNAGYEQWLPLLPAGVTLSNGRGAHGGSTAEWVVAALLAIYRDLADFRADQQAGQEYEALRVLDPAEIVVVHLPDHRVQHGVEVEHPHEQQEETPEPVDDGQTTHDTPKLASTPHDRSKIDSGQWHAAMHHDRGE